MVLSFVQGFFLALPAVIVPSSLKVFLISRTLRDGWKSVWPATFTPLISDLPIALLVILILQQTPAWFFHVLQIAGGAFVIYLAWRLVPFLRAGGVTYRAASPEQTVRTMSQAVGINFLNPIPYIFVSSVIVPRTISGWNQSPGHAFGFLFGFYAALIGGMLLLILVFDQAGKLNPKINFTLLVISILALLILGAQQIWLGAGGILKILGIGYWMFERF
ncbi:MAG: LysE family transporter [Chloroflexi bacterium]|nr:LysE family transporter [Chloroflexota bacterium]